MEPRFADDRERLVAGFNQRYTYQNMGDIPALWQRFAPHINATDQQVGTVCYGLIHGNDDSGFEYMAALDVSTAEGLPEGFTTYKIPAQRYAVFPHDGHVSELSKTIDFIFHDWLPGSGMEPTGQPDLYERYGPDFDPAIGRGDVEVWVPIKPKN